MSPRTMSSETVPELPPDFGRHNMFAFGRDTIFLSQLPMFMAPHDAQLILEMALEHAAGCGPSHPSLTPRWWCP